MATKKDKNYSEYEYKNAWRKGLGVFAPDRNPENKDARPGGFTGFSWDPNAQYHETRQDAPAEGISGLFQGGDVAHTNNARNLGNFLGDIALWFASKSGKPGQGYGDYQYGAAPGTYDGIDLGAGGAGPSSARAQAQAADMRAAKQGGAAGVGAPKDAYDLLAEYMSGQAVKNDARLQSMYKEVADYITGQTGDTKKIYTDAASGYKGANEAATGAVNAGYGTARDQLSRSLQSLGIEDAATNILASGQDMSQQQGAVNSQLGRILGSNLNRNTAAQTGALQNLLALSQATMGEGARARAGYGEKMQGNLLDIVRQQQEAKMSAEQKAAEIAAKGNRNSSATAAEAAQLYNTFYDEAIKRNLNVGEAQREAQTKVDIWKAANGL